MTVDRVRIAQITAPAFKTLEDARKAGSADGGRISSAEAENIADAVNDALQTGTADAALGTARDLQTLAGDLGIGMLESLRQRDFTSTADFKRLFAKALDLASLLPTGDGAAKGPEKDG